jgi:DNA (cytosine-5)-methyltransferase 1
MSLTYGEMFAGYGGLGMGVQSVLGGEMAWCAEFDAAPSKILAHHWPTAPNLGDVTKVDWTNVPKVDVITGGSPCQDLSHAGKRAGMKAGTRSGLWASMCDAIDIIQPRLVVWENVRGALSAEADSALEPCPGCVGDGDDGPVLRALGRVLGDLAELGYDARWYGLRAADVGAAHGRFRVFVFATPADADDSGWGEHRRGVAVRPEQPAAERTGDAALTLLPTPAVNDMGAGKTVDAWDAWTERMQAEHGNGNGHGKSLAIEAQRMFRTPTAQLAVNGGSQHPDKRKDGGHGPTLADEVEHLLPTPTTQPTTGNGHARNLGKEASLLPTPRATDGTKGGPNQRGSSGDLMLPSAVHLLNTPTAADGKRVSVSRRAKEEFGATTLGEQVTQDWREPRAENGNPRNQNIYERPADQPQNLENALYHTEGQDWREYEAAIRRQEHAFGRPAPLPTEPGKNGQPRLSPAFVEWLMNLPEGWVTDPAIGISRNEMLKALGNGVVPAQAAAATRAFLKDVSTHAISA